MIRCSEKAEKDVLAYLEERFGIPRETFRDFSLYESPDGKVFLGPKNSVESPRPAAIGILAARLGDRTVKPSTNILQLFGRLAERSTVQLAKKNAANYARGEDLDLLGEEIGETSEGYVLLKYEGFPLGCGLLKDGKVKNMLPKAKRVELEFI